MESVYGEEIPWNCSQESIVGQSGAAWNSSSLAVSPDLRVRRVPPDRVKRHDVSFHIHIIMADENPQRGDETFEEEEEADDIVRGYLQQRTDRCQLTIHSTRAINLSKMQSS